jgi:ComF family protein
MARRLVTLGATLGATLRSALGTALAPPCCVLCDRPGLPGPIDLCGDCLAELPRAPADAPFDTEIFERVCCPWRFEFPVDALVRALKFHGERAHARLLGTLLARERLRCAAPLPDLVVPVPLHALRLRERGYNQAAELARFAARELSLPLDRSLLARQRATREQSHLHLLERRRNVSGAFVTARVLHGAPRVALVDDVVTTGSTVAAAAAALLAGGAGAVELWVVARASRRGRVRRAEP